MSFVTKFYVSDHHFGHHNIITHCSRPFVSVEEMDEVMIAAWNSVVKPGDHVYVVGDFSLHSPERTAEIFGRLKGQKFLVVGNHDVDRKGRPSKAVRSLGWAAAPSHAIETTDTGCRVYLHHYACRTWPAAHHGAWHFFGHSHGNMPAMGRSRDVGVDVPDVGFQPRTFAELTANMEA